MPVFKTHTEGGSWNGGGTNVPNCSLAMRNAILTAFNNFIGSPALNPFPGLRAALTARFNTIEIDCGGSDCSGLEGFSSGNTINICTTNALRIPPVLLHEMVHAVEGTELDSEAIEHALFVGNGATLPTADDIPKFVSETSALGGDEQVRRGRWVVYRAQTGQIFGRNASGGQGTLSFQSNAWIRTLNIPSGSWV